MGREIAFPLNIEQLDNLNKLLIAVNKLRTYYGKSMIVSSGYRPAEINAKIKGAAKKSNHMICAAIDFKDTDRSIAKFCNDNLNILEDCGLWMEDSDSTPTWVHVQIYPPKSGKRVFKP